MPRPRLFAPLVLVAAMSLIAPAARGDDAVIVKFRAGASAAKRRAAVRSAGAGPRIGAVRGVGARVLAAPADPPEVVAARLNRSSAVLYAEPNSVLHALASPNDPLLGQMGDLQEIGAPAAWDAAGLGGFPATGGVPVAIVDTGIDASHEDLQGKATACATSAGGRLTAGACADDNGHGSHVAGTIGAIADNGAGIAGVAFDSPLIVCKALGGDGGGTVADVANCLSWAHGKGARIISMSLGGPSSTTLANAVAEAWKGGRRGGSLLVAAAGNDGDTSTEYPAGYAEVVSIAAVDDGGAHAPFSNTNADVELAAPGVDVLSVKLGGGYVRYSGTSMATPHVAGVAALALSRHRSLSAAGLRTRLDAAVRDLGAPGRDPQYGFGLVDAAAAAAP